jgi:hypothetical protein
VPIRHSLALDAHYAKRGAQDRADDEEAGRVVRQRGDVETWKQEDGREADFLFVTPNRDGEYGVGYEVERPLERELWALEQEVNAFWAADESTQRYWAWERKMDWKPLTNIAKTNAHVDKQIAKRAEATQARRQGTPTSADATLRAQGRRARAEGAARAVDDLAATQNEHVA